MNRRKFMKPIASAASAVVLSLALLLPAAGSADEMAMSAPPAGSPKIVATDAALRGLWHDHIFWVRNVVVATLAKHPAEAKAAEAQVVANAHALADSIKPFYGDAASQALFPLLAGHYGAIKAYLIATDKGDKAGQQKATDDMMANADKIATFLSGANPNLPKDTVLGLLQAHGGHHIAQIQDLKAGQYDAEAKNWADMEAHMDVISDALTGAIAKQFPDKF
jgi:hypothetical protein